ncbi:MAG TPA: hypothetical protein VG125_17235 [Pirellulales bacterium]|jgi:filamentous hemagglutinin|nr:hypothetical protein [Pirellulales bacterium]
MRIYHPNPKHELSGRPGRKGTKLDLSVMEASVLLNDPVHCLEVPEKRQLVAVKNGKIYVFQDDEVGGYHAYPATGNEVCAKYPAVARRIAELLGTDVKRLSRMQE